MKIQLKPLKNTMTSRELLQDQVENFSVQHEHDENDKALQAVDDGGEIEQNGVASEERDDLDGPRQAHHDEESGVERKSV
jgi:hypothetical protein